ncbi:MAG: BrnA antitoxin family protein, partial [Treponema sp.]|nr:BrnA antitoxin family protein [Treponema sp.]
MVDKVLFVMAMTTITVKAGQKPTKEQIKRIRAAAKAPVTYTPDCPETTQAGLAEFAAKARELRQGMKRTKPAVTIRITPDVLAKYKALGRGYTGIMA